MIYTYIYIYTHQGQIQSHLYIQLYRLKWEQNTIVATGFNWKYKFFSAFFIASKFWVL